jgi:hypothetical protein
VKVEITPEPSEDERRAILEALRPKQAAPAAYESRWRAAALVELGDDSFAQEGGRDAGVVEP